MAIRDPRPHPPEAAAPAEPMSEEAALLGIFRGLNAEGKEKVLTYAADLQRAGIYDEKNNAPRMGASNL